MNGRAASWRDASAWGSACCGFGLLLALAAGCSDPVATSRCTSADHAVPEATDDCRQQPASVESEASIAERLEPVAGGTRLQVLFDEDGTVRHVCADPSPSMSEWRERVRVAGQIDAVLALPPAPACLAGTRIAFNRLAAREAEIDAEIRRCHARVQARREQDSSLVGRGGELQLRRELRRCIEEGQRDAGELWVFDHRGANPLPLVRTRGDAERRSAIRACASRDVTIGRSAFVDTLAVARRGDDWLSCMQEQGWVPYR